MGWRYTVTARYYQDGVPEYSVYTGKHGLIGGIILFFKVRRKGYDIVTLEYRRD